MAVCMALRKSFFLRHFLLFPSKNFTKYFLCTHQDISLGTLDHFTTQLIQRKSEKWKIHHIKQKEDRVKCKTQSEFLIELEDVDRILHDAIEADNALCISNTIQQCIEFKKIPSLSNLLQVYSFYARIGDKDIILKLIDLCKLLDESVLQQYSYFKHYLAEATWVKGNISEAIALFEEVYGSNVYMRRRIRNQLKYLMIDSISNRSEAVLMNIIHFSLRLVENYKDFYPLTCIWKHCILSEWFTDQCIALDLLEKNEGLRKTVISNLSSVVILAIQNHQIDIVYRILEVLMKFDEKAHYGEIVEALFNYRVKQGDLRGCREIVQWCLIQNITLPMFYQEKFVNLLLSHMSNSKANMDTRGERKLTKAPDYRFKF